jgi:hypothetical protein
MHDLILIIQISRKPFNPAIISLLFVFLVINHSFYTIWCVTWLSSHDDSFDRKNGLIMAAFGM